MASVIPLIVITGPTGSGKSGLALELAERYHGEIICADSRTVYRGMNIGTAKPSLDERARVPHHLLDVVNPDDTFTAADFKRLAEKAIADIRARGKVPLLVGGTGLYIDAVILDYQFSAPANDKLRAELNDKSIDELQSMLNKLQLSLPTNPLNKRHLVRAIEQNGINTSSKHEPDASAIVVALATDRDELRQRIIKRIDVMFEAGVIDEARHLAEIYGRETESMTGNIYPILRKVIEGDLSIDEAKALCIQQDMRLAKRQVTWLRRHNYVRWLTNGDAGAYISDHIHPTSKH